MRERDLKQKLTSMTDCLREHFEKFFTIEGGTALPNFAMIQPIAEWRNRFTDYITKMKAIRKENTIKSHRYYLPLWLNYIEKNNCGISDGIAFKEWCE